MARTNRVLGFLLIAAAAVAAAASLSALATPASAFEPPSAAALSGAMCLVDLGSGDGTAGWSRIEITVSRSVDVGLAPDAGLTVACGTLGAASAEVTPVSAPTFSDPSVKGDFGLL